MSHFNITKETESAITNFIKFIRHESEHPESEHPESEQTKILENYKKLYMEKVKKMNYFKTLNIDLILYIFDFMFGDEFIAFPVICKYNYNNFYDCTWERFSAVHFPKSLLTNTKDIRINASIDYYYEHIRPNRMDIKIIETLEDKLMILSEKMDVLDPTIPSELEERKHIYDIEMMDIYEKRHNILENTDKYTRNFLEKIKFVNNECWSGAKTYTIKPKIDIRIYGFDPEIPEEKEKGEIIIKWIKGEYFVGQVDIDWVMPVGFTPCETDPYFLYDWDNQKECWYRFRIRPSYYHHHNYYM